jgi:hypothetical protein
MFEFEFETWFEFELKSLEKIKRKAIRNSLEKEKKTFSAQSAQLGPARPRARPRRLTGGPHLPVTTCVGARALSPSRCPVGQACQRRSPHARAHSLSLSGGPFPSALAARSCSFPLSAPRTPPVRFPVPNLSSTPPPWTRPRPRVFQLPPHALGPFRARTPLAHFPLLICAPSRAPSPSLSPCARNQVAPPPLTDVCHPFYGHRRTPRRVRCPGKLRLSPATWNAP